MLSTHVKGKQIFGEEEPGEVDRRRAEARDDRRVAVGVGRILGSVEVLERAVLVVGTWEEESIG